VYRSHDEQKTADGSHEDENNLRADSRAMSGYMLMCSKKNWGRLMQGQETGRQGNGKVGYG
jgi:hypothetical protein